MSWGAVTNIGTAADAAAATLIIPVLANQLSPAVVIVAVWDLGGTPAAGAVTDTRGNSYTRTITLGGLAVYVSNNSKGILNTNSITYTKVDGVSAAEVTACYSVNTSGFFLDTAVTATNTGTSSTPTVTSGVATMRGNLYFLAFAQAIVAGLLRRMPVMAGLRRRVIRVSTIQSILRVEVRQTRG
jgi:hypothetical protein